ncbi:class I SAM-dependent methyltransferase [Nonomuraea wenchangensis]
MGCGTGETTLLAARQATAGGAVGVDLSAPMPRQARRAAAAAGRAPGRRVPAATRGVRVVRDPRRGPARRPAGASGGGRTVSRGSPCHVLPVGSRSSARRPGQGRLRGRVGRTGTGAAGLRPNGGRGRRGPLASGPARYLVEQDELLSWGRRGPGWRPR